MFHSQTKTVDVPECLRAVLGGRTRLFWKRTREFSLCHDMPAIWIVLATRDELNHRWLGTLLWPPYIVDESIWPSEFRINEMPKINFLMTLLVLRTKGRVILPPRQFDFRRRSDRKPYTPYQPARHRILGLLHCLTINQSIRIQSLFGLLSLSPWVDRDFRKSSSWVVIFASSRLLPSHWHHVCYGLYPQQQSMTFGWWLRHGLGHSPWIRLVRDNWLPWVSLHIRRMLGFLLPEVTMDGIGNFLEDP